LKELAVNEAGHLVMYASSIEFKPLHLPSNKLRTMQTTSSTDMVVVTAIKDIFA